MTILWPAVTEIGAWTAVASSCDEKYVGPRYPIKTMGSVSAIYVLNSVLMHQQRSVYPQFL